MDISPNAHIVILTGAGISKESGLDTFRCEGGIWQQYSLDDVCTPEGFARDPDLVHRFYNDRRRQLADQTIMPNAAHLALAELQTKWSSHCTLITQNIDNLHERAGSHDVIHMHGELGKLKCEYCNASHEARAESSTDSICPVCDHHGTLRPDIVWFGEMPYGIATIDCALADADLFVAIGTSGTVYPAAGFCHYARECGAELVEINLEPSLNAGHFNHTFYGLATEQVPKFVAELLNKWR